jgi:uncharacterized protein YgiM (DUF1202 family)
MKKSYVLFFFLLLAHAGICQFGIEKNLVLATSLNVRTEPRKDAKVVVTIPNGEIVDNLISNDFDTNYETIDGVSGGWKKIKYKNKIGYAFSAYLGYQYMLYYEGSTLDNIPKYKYWYAIYATKKGDVLKKVKIKIKTVKNEEDGHIHKALKTENSEVSLFMIGTNEVLTEKMVGIFDHTPDENGTPYNVDLKPGVKDNLCFKNPTIINPPYHIVASGTYKLYNNAEIIENYKVFVRSSVPTITKKQEITPYLPNPDGWHVMLWVGDLDNDDKPDFILHGGAESVSNVLFLSSKAKAGEFVRPVSSFSFVDEC